MNPPGLLPFQSTQSIGLTILRYFQVALICTTIGLFIVSLPINYDHRRVVCSGESCPSDQLKSSSLEALNRIGMSVETFAATTVALDVLVAAIFTISAVVIFVRKPNDSFTIFVTIMLVTFGIATFTGSIHGIARVYPRLDWLVETIAMIGNCSIIAFLFVFPNGRFVPRWTMFVLIAWILYQLPRYYLPDSPLNLLHSSPGLYNLLFPIGVLTGLGSQIYRYRGVSNATERQQTKWVIYGLAIGIGAYLSLRFISLRVSDPLGYDLPVALGLNIAAIFFMLFIPISISIAVIRFRLWDINPIINRTLVYGTLSALTISFYILVVGLFANYFQQRSLPIQFCRRSSRPSHRRSVFLT